MQFITVPGCARTSYTLPVTSYQVNAVGSNLWDAKGMLFLEH
jgi:hypothetical protein